MESSTTNTTPNGEAPKGTTEGLSPFENDGPTLHGLLCTTLSTVFSADSSSTLFYEVKTACADGGPRVAEACRNTARDVLIWTRKGGTFRALLVVSGGLGFLWTLWLAARKSVDLTKHSLNMTSSAISAYSAARQARHQEPSKSA
ncbi:hypothetical protein QJS10_CPB12g01600 [Acorus calamus]|uniref:Transmembrane protein n=1 Tax=Acorus calamus TaxID=4465 RepID=A0AAV9DN64_ACOCL|nr:hypothetical protein QJS10_CPB12g01600 [Acorus calamus]